MVEAEPFEVRDALQDRGVVVGLVAGAAEQEAAGVRRGEREPLAAGDQRVREGARGLVASGQAVQLAEVTAGEVPGDRAGARAGGAAGQPFAVRRAVGVHRAVRVLDEFGRDALEHECGAEHGVPRAHGQPSRAELRGAPVGHAGDDRRALGDAGGLGGGGADRGDRGAGAYERRERAGGDAQRVEDVRRPALLDQVGSGLQGVAQISGHGVPGQPPVDEVGLVGDVAGTAMAVQEPEELGQRPRGLHPPVAELRPHRGARLVHPAGLLGGTGVVVHQGRG